MPNMSVPKITIGENFYKIFNLWILQNLTTKIKVRLFTTHLQSIIDIYTRYLLYFLNHCLGLKV